MAADPLTDLRSAIADAASSLGNGASAHAKLERPPKVEFGDYSTNAAMLLAPSLGEAPRPVAEKLGGLVGEKLAASIQRVDVAGPGFLNLFMTDDWYRDAVAGVVDAGDSYGSGRARKPERVLVEFVSANPTGPLTAASGRHAAYGDSLARILEFAGHEVEREFYVNDHGTQVLLFGESIKARATGQEPPEGGYKGDYVKDLADEIEGAAERDPADLAREGVAHMTKRIRETLHRFRVEMDIFFSELTLHEKGEVQRIIDKLVEQGHAYTSEGATWLRTTSFGDDKDRVLQRTSGDFTYFGTDIAHHEDKQRRGYERAINVLGADHHGYVERILASWEALGAERDTLEVLIMQLVNLTEGGERARMSKRQGDFVTLDDLIDDIGVDVARYFMLQRSHDTALDLDLQLARDHSDKNPVYYVQYGHARVASILRAADGQPDPRAAGGELHPSEKLLIKRLLEFPGEIDIAIERRAPHRMTTYAHQLTQDFTAFYRDCKVVGTPEEPFRLSLCVAAQRVIARSLDLLGVSAPEKM